MAIKRMGTSGSTHMGTTATTATTVPTLADLYQSYKQREEEVYTANTARQQEIENILAQQLAMYEPGGAFEQSALKEIQKEKVRDIGAVSQRDISRGMYGIRPYETEWEYSVGTGARLKLEDIMQQRRSAVLGARAGFLESIQEPYPDTSGLVEAMAAGTQASPLPAETPKTPSSQQSLSDWLSANFVRPGATGGGGGTTAVPDSTYRGANATGASFTGTGGTAATGEGQAEVIAEKGYTGETHTYLNLDTGTKLQSSYMPKGNWKLIK